jgi:hypothetical protein
MKLAGVVSQETLLSQLDFVEDAAKEMERITKEQAVDNSFEKAFAQPELMPSA